MAEPLCSSSSNLLVLMDVLWFQQIILLSSQPIISTNTTLPHIKTSASTTQSSRSPSYLISSQEDVSPSSDPSPISLSQDECDDADDEEEEVLEETSYKRKRPTRLSLVIASKTRSHSSSPSVHKLPKHLRSMGSEGNNGLRKTRSCKSLMELEYEEVKGFMDLGFTFNKEQLSPRMMSVIPGLQRLRHQHGDQVLVVEDEKRSSSSRSSTSGVIKRPYLSEAWLIKRPDSPLLNLKMPSLTASADMKKHLRYWARTVASAIQLEY